MDLIETVKTVKHIRARFEVTELITMRNALQVYMKYADQVGEYDGYNAECVMRKLEELFHDDEVNILYNNTKGSIKDKMKLRKMVNIKDWEELNEQLLQHNTEDAIKINHENELKETA